MEPQIADYDDYQNHVEGLSKRDEQLINESVDEVIGNKEEADGLKLSGNFEGEVWLSTDGKHTVRIKANTEEDRKQALIWAKKVYEAVVARYGTKQALNAKTYQNPKNTEDKSNQATCTHTEYAVKIAGPTSKNPGKSFKSCRSCNKFLGFV